MAGPERPRSRQFCVHAGHGSTTWRFCSTADNTNLGARSNMIEHGGHEESELPDRSTRSPIWLVGPQKLSVVSDVGACSHQPVCQ